MDDRMLRVQDACDYLGVSRSTFWRWRRRGVVGPGREIGSVKLWRPSELAAAVEKYRADRLRRNLPSV